MRLPREAEIQLRIKTHLETEFEISSEILDIATGIFRPDSQRNPRDGLTDEGVAIARGLLAKSCKQFRAIGQLVELGLGEVAESNSRMLLETLLAIEFILRPRIVLKENGRKVTNKDGKAWSTKDGKPLTARFRAELYLAKVAFDDLRIVRDSMDTPGLSELSQRRNARPSKQTRPSGKKNSAKNGRSA